MNRGIIPTNIHLICNPVSGNGQGGKACRKVEALLEAKHIPAVFHRTSRPLEAIDLSRQAVQEGADTIIAIGGDGTLHEVAQSLTGSPVVMGIIPAGTGNDYVKSVGIPTQVADALDIALYGSVKPVDTVSINDRLLLNEAGCGFDVMVLDYAEQAKKAVKGILPYLYGVLQTIFHYHGIEVRIAIDDGPLQEKRILVLAVGNGRYIGGGIPIAPGAVVDDGKLDVLIVDQMRRLRMLRALPGLLKGKILDFPETLHQYAKSIRLAGSRLRVNIDGEIITLDDAVLSIRPASLLLRRP